MTSLDEALVLSEQEQDEFYTDAFLIQTWLAECVRQTEKEYTAKRKNGQRVLQLGLCQCAFLRVFGPAGHSNFYQIQHNLYRFTEFNHPMSNILFRAIIPLALEHELAGDFTGERAVNPDGRPREALALMRTSFDRWCDWLDAVIHLQTHARWHLSREEMGGPAAADRVLARFGYRPLWPFQEVDEAVICLWPLAKRHNWSYGDLLSVLRDVLRRPEVHVCRSEQVFANYCSQALGLRRTGQGNTVHGSRPQGYELALRLCPPLRRPSDLGLPPWCWEPAEAALPVAKAPTPSLSTELFRRTSAFAEKRQAAKIPAPMPESWNA
jgi:hypothetical protein